MATSNTSSSNAINQGSQQYPYPSHVNAISFVSIRLSGEPNYVPWREQMMCLLKSHDMIGFINGTFKKPQKSMPDFEVRYKEWEMSDTLVKGWIYGSLSEFVMGTVVGLETASDVWNTLQKNYTSPPAPATPPPPPVTVTTVKGIEVGEYIPLHRAIQMGDWEKAQEFFNEDQEALVDRLLGDGTRALHVAVGDPKNIDILEKLLEQINPGSLPTLVETDQLNALHFAAVLDNKIAAMKLVGKNPDLLFIIDKDGYLPIQRAILNAHRTTFLYLIEVCKEHIGLSQKEGSYNPFEGGRGAFLVINTISSGFFDVGTQDHRLRNTYKIHDIENQETCRANLVTKCMKSYVYPVFQRIYVKFWDAAVLHVPHIKHIHEDKVKHNFAVMILKFICEEVAKLKSNHFEHYGNAFIAAVNNNTPEVIEHITRIFPNAIWTNENGYRFAQLSIINRCENVYNFLVHEVTDNKYLHIVIDKDKNTLLHLVARLAPIHKLNRVTGAALQMQRELQWFQEVSKFLRPIDKEAKNNKQETPITVFRKAHENLRKEGEEWMKKTADSYTITAALIITIVFAAAITVPGGTSEDNGIPIKLTNPSFIIFAISDAISLFTSTTSLLLFLSILTARYAEEDFLYKLPLRLILGLVMLFMSVTTMMVAFSATLYIMFAQGKSWILVPVAALTSLPIASFVTLQLPLLVDLISSTYGRGIFGKRSELRITS